MYYNKSDINRFALGITINFFIQCDKSKCHDYYFNSSNTQHNLESVLPKITVKI